MGATARGTSHAKSDTRLQDAYKCSYIENTQALLAVVSDGAGSASRGGEGASLICRTLTSLARKYSEQSSEAPSNDVIRSWISVIRSRIDEAACNRNLKPREFAATLVCAVYFGGRCTFVHIGDGCAVYQTQDSSDWVCASWPEHGEYASTTSFITDLPEPNIRITVIDANVSAICLLTDGLERLGLQLAAQRPFAPFFDGLLRPVVESKVIGRDTALSSMLAKYLDSEAINARTDDDKSLVLAVRR